MQIRMLKTVAGSDDGARTRTFEAGQVYELGPSPRALELAAVFLREGWASAAGVEHQVVPQMEVQAPPARETTAPSKPGRKGR